VGRRFGSYGASPHVSIAHLFDVPQWGSLGVMRRLVTVVETAAYLARSEKLLDVSEREALKLAIAADPLAGDLIRGSGGVRKLRFGLGGRGKRGGVRVIYFFHNDRMPAFLLTVFAKNERSDLSQAEIAALRRLVGTLVETYGEGR
jgi:hypothetical protein